MVDFIACFSPLRSRIAFILLLAMPIAAIATQPTHPVQQNPLPAYPERNAAKTSAAAASRQSPPAASNASPRKRAGRTPMDDLMGRFRIASGKNASLAHGVKPNDQVSFTIPQFLTAPQFATSGVDQSSIFASAEGDFNNDGVADVATLNLDGGLNVFLNTGNGVMKSTYFDGSLAAPGNQTHNMLQLATGDVNGDGFADIVGLDAAANQFEVWLSKGDGTLSAPTAYSVTPKSGASFLAGGAIALADVTGDGHLDVVALSEDYQSGVPRTAVSLQVFAGNGDGTLAAPTEFDTTLSDSYYTMFGQSLVLADVDGDGIMDAVVLLDDQAHNSTAGLGVMTAKGDGKGGFGTLSGYTGAFVAGAQNDFYGTSNMAVMDLNKDGAADVAFNDGFGTLYVALNQGGGSFAPAKSVLQIDGNTHYQFGDMNGDKIPDVVAFGTGSVSVYAGKGDGTFSTTPHVYSAGLGPGNQQPALANYTSAGNQALGVVYVSEEQFTGNVLLGNGDGTLQAAPILLPLSENVDNTTVFGSGDIDGDGIPDFVAYDYTNEFAPDNPNNLPAIVSMISDGKGGIKKSVTAIPDSYFIQQNATFVDAEPMVADLNGDGRADLLLSLGTDIEIALGNGDGTFQTPKILNLGPGFAQLDCPPGLASAGKGADNVLEFVVAYGGDDGCYSSGSQVSGVFAFTNGGANVNFTPLGAALADVKLYDLNSDGILDLITNDADGVNINYAVYVTEGTGSGTFDVTTTSAVVTDFAVSSILTGDYNEDGKPDLALTAIGVVDPLNGDIESNSGGVLLLPGNDNGTFGTTTEVDGGSTVVAAAWGDFNGDGHPDLAVSQYLDFANPYPFGYFIEEFNFAVLPNAGDGTFAYSNAYGVLSAYPMFTADYNGDGNTDAAFASGPGSGLTMMLNAIPNPSFTLSAAPASLTLVQGATGIATVTVAANFAFNGQVSLSCAGAPSESTCTVSLETLALSSSQTASFSVVVATTAPNNSYSAATRSSVPGWTALACVFAIFLPGRKRLGRAFPMLLALFAISTVGALTGCGSSGVKPPLYPGTPVGSSTITITATSGKISQTFKLPVTVTANTVATN
jgi:hypothetical protein